LAPYAIRIQSLPDLKAATKWLTNSDSFWQGVSNLLNKDTSLLISHVFPASPHLNQNVKIYPQPIHLTHHCHGLFQALAFTDP
jgi:hypothetical protein